MENGKNNVLLTVIGIATLLVVLVGASFAYFTATADATVQNITTGILNITSVLGETEETNIKPTTWSEDSADGNPDIAKFTFTVTGVKDEVATTVDDATYDIQLAGEAANVKKVLGEDSQTLLGSVAEIKYALYKGTAANGTLVKTGDFLPTGEYTETKADNSELYSYKTNEATVVNSTSYALTGTTNDSYTLYVYIEESTKVQDNLQAVTITATMNALAKTPAPAGA